MNQLQIYDAKNTFVNMFDDKKIDLLKNTICKGSSNDELELFLHACQRTGLDPFMKQIYAVKRWDNNLKRDSMTIQTAIDGYRLIAERTGKYSPGREPTYQYDDKGNIISSTAYIKKQTADGTWHEVAATAFFNEYCQKTKEGRPTKFWMQLGHAMIAKCAEALALRKAFPGDLSGIYTKEEMQQADIEVGETNLDNKKVETIQITSQPQQKHIVHSHEMIENTSKDSSDQFADAGNMIQTISEDEWRSLKILVNKCSTKFQENIWNKLESEGIFDDNFREMSKDLYMQILLACEGHLMKMKKKEKENENNQA